jgi:hypothetical protein
MKEGDQGTRRAGKAKKEREPTTKLRKKIGSKKGRPEEEVLLCSPHQVAEGGGKIMILSKETATKLLGVRILGGSILPGSSLPRGKPTTVLAVSMAQMRVPFHGAAAY